MGVTYLGLNPYLQRDAERPHRRYHAERGNDQKSGEPVAVWAKARRCDAERHVVHTHADRRTDRQPNVIPGRSRLAGESGGSDMKTQLGASIRQQAGSYRGVCEAKTGEHSVALVKASLTWA